MPSQAYIRCAGCGLGDRIEAQHEGADENGDRREQCSDEHDGREHGVQGAGLAVLIVEQAPPQPDEGLASVPSSRRGLLEPVELAGRVGVGTRFFEERIFE